MAYRFVVFEGIDGCGKQTQADALERLLRRRRVGVTRLKYPTDKAKEVHGHLEGGKTLGPDELFARFLDDIAQGQGEVRDALRKGWVIADRYAISTAAYQGTGGKLEERRAAIEARGLIKPDVVLWLDLGVEESMRRKAGQKAPDRHERDRAFLEEVAAHYARLEREQFLCKHYRRIDAAQSPERVAEDIRNALDL